jgi:hypothetical protein
VTGASVRPLTKSLSIAAWRCAELLEFVDAEQEQRFSPPF